MRNWSRKARGVEKQASGGWRRRPRGVRNARLTWTASGPGQQTGGSISGGFPGARKSSQQDGLGRIGSCCVLPGDDLTRPTGEPVAGLGADILLTGILAPSYVRTSDRSPRTEPRCQRADQSVIWRFRQRVNPPGERTAPCGVSVCSEARGLTAVENCCPFCKAFRG